MTSAPKKSLPSSPPPAPTTTPPTTNNQPGVPSIAPLPHSPRLQNKICIITGCNSALGIGRATAYAFASAGAKALILCDLTASNLETWKLDLNGLYPETEVQVRALDASDEVQVKGVVGEAVSRWGRLDVFFANAGVGGTPSRVWEVEEEGEKARGKAEDEFMRTMRVNALSVFLATKHASSAMLKNHPPSGSIISTASVAGLRSNAGPTDYSASKAAVISLSQTCAYQLAGTGIRVNCVCPGIIETGMTAIMYEMARARGSVGKIGQLNPLKRGGLADEIARVALFLASDEASYVNGQAWAVDGGLSAGLPFVPGKLA